MIKAGKIAVKKTVSRGGKTFQQTFYVSPEDVQAMSDKQAAQDTEVFSRLHKAKKSDPWDGRRRPTLENATKASPEELEQSKDGLKQWFTRTDQIAGFPEGTTAKLMAARYKMELTQVRPYGGETTFEFSIVPRGGEAFHGVGMTGGRRGAIFDSPKDAIEEIPVNPDFAYRGLAWEEWQAIRKNKKIQSRGGYNIGQEGLTFFGEEPGTGESYASGFAPIQHLASKKRPGVVIAIPKKHTLSHKDRDDIPAGELAIKGSLPMEEIKGVWTLTPTSSRVGKFELVRTQFTEHHRTNPNGVEWKEGSRSTPRVATALRALPKESWK